MKTLALSLVNKESISIMLKNPILVFMGIISATVFTHWSLIQWYAYYCAPTGWLGPLKTFLTLGSPTCHFVNIAQVELAKHYITIWIGAAASIVTWIASNLTS